MADRHFGSASGLTGGAAGNLDAISYAALSNDDIIFTTDSGVLYIHIYNSASSAAESSPDVIAPDDIGAGDGRHILLAMYMSNAGAVMNVDFDADTILAAESDNTPVALTVAAQRIVGRKTGGHIAALTAAEILAILGVEAGADVTDTTNVNAAGAVMESDFDAGTFLYAINDDTPVVKTRAEIMALLSGQAAAAFSMNSKKITSLADPVDDQDGTTKAWVLANAGAGIALLKKTAAYTVQSGDLAGLTIISNEGATGDIVITLPALTDADRVMFLVTEPYYIRVNTDGSEVFSYGGDDGAAGGYIRSNEVGVSWTITAVGKWYIGPLTGTLLFDE